MNSTDFKAKAIDILERAGEEGWVEIRPGTYLNTQASLEREQVEWDDEDACKDHDFSTNPYWLTFDNGSEPIGVSGADDSELTTAIGEQDKSSGWASRIEDVLDTVKEAVDVIRDMSR